MATKKTNRGTARKTATRKTPAARKQAAKRVLAAKKKPAGKAATASTRGKKAASASRKVASVRTPAAAKRAKMAKKTTKTVVKKAAKKVTKSVAKKAPKQVAKKVTKVASAKAVQKTTRAAKTVKQPGKGGAVVARVPAALRKSASSAAGRPASLDKQAVPAAKLPRSTAAPKSVARTADKPAVRRIEEVQADNVVRKPTPSAAGTQEADTKEPAGAVTPEQALANTRALLEAKQEREQQAPPWRVLEAAHGQGAAAGGFQSDEAAQKAGDQHAGESRMQAIQGSVGSQGRHRQGKRDSR